MKHKHTIHVRTDDNQCYDIGGINLTLELTIPYRTEHVTFAEAIARAINEKHPKNNYDAATAIAEELQALGIETTVVWPEKPIFEIRTRYGEAHVIKINGD